MENGERRESELPEAAIGGQLGETFPVSFKVEFGLGKGKRADSSNFSDAQRFFPRRQ